MNSVQLVGRMTADPELKKTNTGVSVVSFTIAVNRGYVKKGEERKADFIDIVAWRNTAEFIAKYFSKGKQVGICGEINTRMYKGSDDKNHKVVEVVADKVEFVGDYKKVDVDINPPESSPTEDTEDDFVVIDNDEDLPF